MSFRLYKEGQGTWARGTLAFLLGMIGVFAAVRLSAFLEAENMLSGTFPLWPLGWEIRVRQLLSVLILLPFGAVGIWLYNKPNLADFLIETESELKNKVTWPSRKEATNNSIVVVVTCFLLGAWIWFADVVLNEVKKWIYDINF